MVQNPQHLLNVAPLWHGQVDRAAGILDRDG